MARGKLFSGYEKRSVYIGRKSAEAIGECYVWAHWDRTKPQHSKKLVPATVGGQVILVCEECKKDLAWLEKFLKRKK